MTSRSRAQPAPPATATDAPAVIGSPTVPSPAGYFLVAPHLSPEHDVRHTVTLLRSTGTVLSQITDVPAPESAVPAQPLGYSAADRPTREVTVWSTYRATGSGEHLADLFAAARHGGRRRDRRLGDRLQPTRPPLDPIAMRAASVGRAAAMAITAQHGGIERAAA